MQTQTIRTVDLTATASRAERDQLAARTDVLDKVKVLRTLPDDVHVTSDMVAEFYEVPVKTIQTLVLRNADEIDQDGYRVVTRGAFEEAFNVKVSSSASRIALFPRRAVLRIGMLLRNSDIAKQVRTMLLDVEQASPAMTDDEIVMQALQIQGRKIEVLTEKVAELEPKAAMADDYLLAQGGARLVREVAKTLGWQEKVFRRWLIDEKLIFVKHSPCGAVQYDFYAQYAHHFIVREKVVEHQWGSCTHYTLMILPRGVELIHRRIHGGAA